MTTTMHETESVAFCGFRGIEAVTMILVDSVMHTRKTAQSDTDGVRAVCAAIVRMKETASWYIYLNDVTPLRVAKGFFNGCDPEPHVVFRKDKG